MKTSSSKPAISMIIEKLENEIFIITRYFTKFSMLLLYLKKVSQNASINIRFNRFMTNVAMEMEAFEKNSNWRWWVLNKHKKL